MRYKDINEGGWDQSKRAFKREELGWELRHEDNMAQSRDIKMIALHYFNMSEQDAKDFAYMKLKKDKNGRWYLPQYNVSGRVFNANFATLTNSFGQARTVRL
jgi:hypothetical protein